MNRASRLLLARSAAVGVAAAAAAEAAEGSGSEAELENFSPIKLGPPNRSHK